MSIEPDNAESFDDADGNELVVAIDDGVVTLAFEQHDDLHIRLDPDAAIEVGVSLIQHVAELRRRGHEFDETR